MAMEKLLIGSCIALSAGTDAEAPLEVRGGAPGLGVSGWESGAMAMEPSAGKMVMIS